MQFRSSREIWRRIVAASFVAVALAISLTMIARADGATPPLGVDDFTPSAVEGFRDRNNSWAWSMNWFNNKLYLGTNRAFACVSAQATHATNPAAPYPPTSPDVVCTPSPADLPMQAEIWEWSPDTNKWVRRYQSPNNIPNPNPNDAGKFLPPDIGYRTGTVYTTPDNQQYMFFGGVTTSEMGFGKVPPPRLLYTTDGTDPSTYIPVPQTPGTFLGNLTLASFRSLTQFGNQLFVINGNIQGAGPIIASSTPLLGDNAWAQVTPFGESYYQLAVFNGWLYAAIVDTVNGYQIVKTQASGPLPYKWTTVIDHGAYLQPTPPQYAISMIVYNGRLYAGTANPPELVRINTDDTWDLVVGNPRMLPDGTWKYPLSGLGEGISNDFNLHIWRMGVHANQLYLGTFDNSVNYLNQPLTPQIVPQMGFDLYRTVDGWRMSAVNTSGFNNEFDFGVRNFTDTPYGLFFGTANFFYGLNVFRGVDGSTTRLPAPNRSDVEISHNQPVLSWDPVPGAAGYHVFRAPMVTVNIPIIGNVKGGTFTYPGPFVEMTSANGIADTVFVDSPMTTTNPTYEYYVKAVDAKGNGSDPSAIALAPSWLPPTTFASLLQFANTLDTRGRLLSPSGITSVTSAIRSAQENASNGQVGVAITTLEALDRQVLNGSVAMSPDSTDLGIMLGKMERRLKLANSLLVDLASLQQ